MGLISQTKRIVVQGFKFAAITAFTLGPLLSAGASSLAGVKKASTLYCTSLSCFGQFISPTGPFFAIMPREAFCLTRSHLQSDFLKNGAQKSHFSSFYTKTFTLVEKSFVSFSFVSGLVTHCSEQAGKKGRKKKTSTQQR